MGANSWSLTRRRFVKGIAAVPAGAAAVGARTKWGEEFASPGPRLRPITWYFPSGPDSAKIASDLDRLQKLGLGGLCIMPASSALKVRYLSPEYWETIRLTVEECVRRRLRVWLYDELDYPSSSAGGETLRLHPEYGVTALEYAGGETAFVKRVGDPLAEIARGRAGLVRPLANLLDANAIREFLSNTYEAYARNVGHAFGSTIEAMFTDEPCLHIAGYWEFGEKPEKHRPLLPWVDEFPEYFRTRKGYEISPLLDRLVEEGAPDASKVRCDYWEVVCELITESYFGQIRDWCGRHQIAFSGHQLLEEGLLLHLMFSGSLIRNAARQHIPGMDLIGPRPEGVSLEDTMTKAGGPYVGKLLSSAAHTRGKSEVMSESFAASGYEMTLEKIVAIANWQFATGVTEIMPMGHHYLRPRKAAAASDAEKRFYQDAFFEDPSFYATYLGRCKALLTGGVHVADVAVLVPEASIWANYTPAPVGLPYESYRRRNPVAAEIDDQFARLSMELLHNQLDFDYLDDEAFLKAEIVDRQLRLAGESYRVLVLPAATTMRHSVADRIAQFRRAGGIVVAVGRLPHEAMERGKDESVRELLEGLNVLAIEQAPAAIRRLSEADLELATPQRQLYYIHKRRDGLDIYFFANMADHASEAEVAFHRGRRPAWLADPRSGKTTALRSIPTTLALERLSARFVVFGS